MGMGVMGRQAVTEQRQQVAMAEPVDLQVAVQVLQGRDLRAD